MPDVGSAATQSLQFVDHDALRDWLVEQRWFASKANRVAGLEIAEAIPLREESPVFVIAFVEARFPAGTHELYQVPVGVLRSYKGSSEPVVSSGGGFTVYDALDDPAYGRELLRHMRSADVLPTEHGQLTFSWEGAPGASLDGVVDVRTVGAEQSNSSIVFGDSLILKSFRRLEPGVNPELELLRFLSAHGFANIPALAGWYEYSGTPLVATMGIVQEYLAGSRDGWELTLDELASSADAMLDRLAELGRVTAEMHSVLGSDAGDPAFAPDEPSTEARSLLIATVEEEIERIFTDLPEDDEAVAPIVGRGDDVRAALQNLTQLGVGGRVIRNHGDFHLGQTLLADDRWVIIDFEGEPARSLPERRQKRSPLRDVAGMLRSFAYAASASSILRGVPAPADWERRAREAFLGAYFERVDPSLLPPSHEAIERLLAVFELEKAVYELRYELNNRPDWVGIPVAGILRLLEESP
jgi:trehalose synthase-fused probable maltokinase